MESISRTVSLIRGIVPPPPPLSGGVSSCLTAGQNPTIYAHESANFTQNLWTRSGHSDPQNAENRPVLSLILRNLWTTPDPSTASRPELLRKFAPPGNNRLYQGILNVNCLLDGLSNAQSPFSLFRAGVEKTGVFALSVSRSQYGLQSVIGAWQRSLISKGHPAHIRGVRMSLAAFP